MKALICAAYVCLIGLPALGQEVINPAPIGLSKSVLESQIVPLKLGVDSSMAKLDEWSTYKNNVSGDELVKFLEGSGWPDFEVKGVVNDEETYGVNAIVAGLFAREGGRCH